VRAQISERYGSAGAAPEIHAPRQEEGDITFVPFFVNRAFVPPPETKAERTDFEFAVADLKSWLANTRVAAVVTLEELLSRTQSAAFRAEILNRLRNVQETDDSQRVRTKCEEVLAPVPSEPPFLDPPVTPSAGAGGELPGAKKPILPPPKALLTLAGFVIGAVILAVAFFFAPDTYNLDTLIKAVWSKTSGDSNSDRIREAERKAAADAKSEADRIAKENAAKAEADRIANENAAKAEADRIANENAAKAEADRIAKENAAKAEADPLEMPPAKPVAPAVAPAPRRIQEGPRRAERGSSDSKLQKSCFLFNGEKYCPP
jgi:hypothetical protein